MKNSFLKIIFVLVFFLFVSLPFVASASTTDNVSGWGWSSNIGWISFNSTNCDTDNNGFWDVGCGGYNDSRTPVKNYGVDIANNGNMSGHAWSSNIGWISFNESDLIDCPSPGTCRAKLNGNSLSGWAKALSADGNGWDGWISLKGTNPTYSVTLTDTASTLPSQYDCKTDCVWGSDVVGWVDFSGVTVGATAIDVSCNVLPPSIKKGEQATWTATVVGAGASDASYTYIWTGTDGLSGTTTTNTITKTYNSPGTYFASVTATSNGVTVGPIPCSGFLTVDDNSSSSYKITVKREGSVPPAGTGECYVNEVEHSCNNDSAILGINGDNTASVSVPTGFRITRSQFCPTGAPCVTSSFPANRLKFPLNSNTDAIFSFAVNGDGNSCSISMQHYKCDNDNDVGGVSSPTKWTWTCGTTKCSEKKRPGFIEN